MGGKSQRVIILNRGSMLAFQWREFSPPLSSAHRLLQCYFTSTRSYTGLFCLVLLYVYDLLSIVLIQKYVCVYEYDVLQQCWIFCTSYTCTTYKCTSLLYSDGLIIIAGVSNQVVFFLQDIHYKLFYILIFSILAFFRWEHAKIASMVKMITIKNSLRLVTSIKVSRLTIWSNVVIKLLLFDQVAIFMWKIFPLIYYNVYLVE